MNIMVAQPGACTQKQTFSKFYPQNAYMQICDKNAVN